MVRYFNFVKFILALTLTWTQVKSPLTLWQYRYEMMWHWRRLQHNFFTGSNKSWHSLVRLVFQMFHKDKWVLLSRVWFRRWNKINSLKYACKKKFFYYISSKYTVVPNFKILTNWKCTGFINKWQDKKVIVSNWLQIQNFKKGFIDHQNPTLYNNLMLRRSHRPARVKTP